MNEETCNAVRNLIDFTRECLKQNSVPNGYVEPASFVEEWCNLAEHHLDCFLSTEKCQHNLQN